MFISTKKIGLITRVFFKRVNGWCEFIKIGNIVKAIGVHRRHYVTMFKEHGNMN